MDSLSAYIAAVEVSFHGINPMSALWVRLFITMFLNAYIVGKGINAATLQSAKDAKTLGAFKKTLNSDGASSFHNFIGRSMDYFRQKKEGFCPVVSTPPDTSVNVGDEFHVPDSHVSHTNKVAQFNLPQGVHYRLHGLHIPQKSDANHRRCCFMCDNRSHFVCVNCDVGLCVPTRGDEPKAKKQRLELVQNTCWAVFHGEQTLPCSGQTS